jgi:predicted nucleic acid-binding protein
MSAALLVADSGPLIALARLDLLDLPARYFDTVLVTATVWGEVTRKPGADEAPRLASAVAAELIQVVPNPESIPVALLRQTIDAGERGAIALGIELNASLLMDDRRARQVAVELGRPVIGTLGLLLRAREEGFVPALRPLTDHLQASGYYLPADLVEEILSSLRE